MLFLQRLLGLVVVELSKQQFGSMLRGDPTSDPEEKKARIAAANAPDYHDKRLALKRKNTAKHIANTGS